ncbi:MAG: esterase-like activity of phytase family protein [Phycisphaerales bacterium]|nr:esterase-like activity of phytase family protein [Phycisphaerales bacterium]
MRLGSNHITFRGLALLAGAVFLLVPVSCASARGELEITHRGMINLPSSTQDQNGQTFTITGMSGITMIPGTHGPDHGKFLAVMDNSNKLIRIDIAFNADGSGTAAVTGGISLAQPRDYEGIVACDVGRGTVFISEENTPAVHEYRLSDGALLRTLPTPAVFTNRRPNNGFESLGGIWLTASPTQIKGTLWTANEEALTVDGGVSTPTTGTVVRLLRYTISGAIAMPGPQYAYVTEPMHGASITSARSGLSDLVMLPDGRILTLERSFAFSALGLFRTRIFEIDFEGVTDVSGMSGLIGQSYTPISTANGRKAELWAGDLSNFEGLTMGPRLASGNWSLVGIVDDDDPISTNQVGLFELAGLGNVPIRRSPGLP